MKQFTIFQNFHRITAEMTEDEKELPGATFSANYKGGRRDICTWSDIWETSLSTSII